MSSENDRLVAAITARIEELRLTIGEFIDATGLSHTAVYNVLNGRPRRYAATTKRGFEKALRWAPGSFDTVAQGGDPTPLDAPAPTWEVKLSELASKVQALEEWRAEIEVAQAGQDGPDVAGSGTPETANEVAQADTPDLEPDVALAAKPKPGGPPIMRRLATRTRPHPPTNSPQDWAEDENQDPGGI